MASQLPTHALGQALEPHMAEGDEWTFVFRKTGDHVNVVFFSAGPQPEAKEEDEA